MSTTTNEQTTTTGASTVAALALAAAERHEGVAMSRLDGRGGDIGYAELGRAVREIAQGLIALGIEPGDRVAILAGTRPEWTLADFGALCAGGVVAPIYHTNSPPECAHVLSHSGARVVFCEDAEQYAKVQAVRDRCPQLEHAITVEPFEKGPLSLAALRELGADVAPGAVEERVAATGRDDLATIVYTSGTTGPPKGCMISHGNLAATVAMYERQVDLAGATVYMFLPLAHSLARVVELVSIDVGGTMAFWSGDPKRILEELTRVQPTHLPSVPRIFEKIHTAAVAGMAEQGPARGAIARWALEEGRRARAREREGRGHGVLSRGRLALADRLVLSKVRGLFGGELRLALTGAAPIARDVLEFFDACGVLVLEGYGLTESCAAATLNVPGRLRFGSVGPALPGTGIRTAPDGEILLSGPNVFGGYYRDEHATAATLPDGWLRTGDLGRLDEDGFLHITGRKKDLIITSSGKNISPTNIENELRESRWISEAVVYGDNRPYLVALLTLDPEEAPKLAASLGVDPDPASMSADPRVHEALQAEVDAVNERFARIEQIKRFAVLDHDLTQAEGELTPTLKVKRDVVHRRYAEAFESLYAEPGAT